MRNYGYKIIDKKGSTFALVTGYKSQLSAHKSGLNEWRTATIEFPKGIPYTIEIFEVRKNPAAKVTRYGIYHSRSLKRVKGTLFFYHPFDTRGIARELSRKFNEPLLVCEVYPDGKVGKIIYGYIHGASLGKIGGNSLDTNEFLSDDWEDKAMRSAMVSEHKPKRRK